MKGKPLAVAALLLAGGFALPAKAELRPKWELGVGATAFTLPDYRGSDERRDYLFPLPFFVYRGEKVRVDRQGMRGIFFETDRVQFDISLSGSPPVDSARRRSTRSPARASGCSAHSGEYGKHNGGTRMTAPPTWIAAR